ncbi:aspartate aminotransferase family protein [Haliangium ochraceum]|uniref:Acetylornithine aminotransferase n=1 Tax=Haliangium ochraceum (strain DSM 14365 / JCM 11303 / SMP-2) TaxID=502025 RepID=D0LJ07_HALO1|nr:aspartate aminotransferase family protein [Haliangium ochraceum]ACY13036.1 acetylornithine and succinylornithine aminotransferase [Haliangium ochraceum DSM 14365]
MNENQQETLIALADRVLLKNYRQQPIVMSHGAGVELWDAAGNRYLDMTAGISVCSLGHAHPALTRAVAEQAGKLVHTSNLYFIEQQIRAAEAITERCFAERVFFANSGAEANEAALKLARRYQHVVAEQPERDLVCSTTGSFHGRSFATVSITGQDKYREGFGPMFGPVEFVPFGDVEAAARVLETRKACAFIVEPVQAEGGIIEPPPGYLASLRKLCDDTGTLLIFDEVQTGIGRTGTWFAHQAENVVPDVMTLAKALAGGVPIGAMVATERAAQGLTFVPGGAVPHASTFGGNPLACAAALAVIHTIDSEGLLERAQRVGAYLGDKLTALVERFPDLCEESRGRGLLRGLALSQPASELVGQCRARGLLLSVAGGTVIRFAPALIVEESHIDEAIATLTEVLAAAAQGGAK